MGEAERIDLNEIARYLEPAKLVEAADFIEWLQAKQDRELPPVLRDAPVDDEPLTPEEEAAIAEARAEMAAGAMPISWEQIKAEFGL